MKVFFLLLVLLTATHATPIKMLEFYQHDIANLNNPSNSTVILIAGPRAGFKSTIPGVSNFGSLFIMDDVLTTGPSITSPHIGRAKGTYMTDDSTGEAPILFVAFVIVLKDGTISLHGQTINSVFDEIAVVGGTGAYRFATGYAQLTTYEVIPPFSAVFKVQVFYKN